MTSTSSARFPAIPVVLPGIRDIFPEHLGPHRNSLQTNAISDRPLSPPFSFDVLKRGPRTASLIRLSPRRQGFARADSISMSSDGDADADEEQSEGPVDQSKKHVCPTCRKRFNRPSSLRIHVNSHTGALPYVCPHPNCGRGFNVNSNMRRHYRNHFASGHTDAGPVHLSPTLDSSPSSNHPAHAPEAVVLYSHSQNALPSSSASPLTSPPSYNGTIFFFPPSNGCNFDSSSSSASGFSPSEFTPSLPVRNSNPAHPAYKFEPVINAVHIHPRVLETASRDTVPRNSSRGGYSYSDVRSERVR